METITEEKTKIDLPLGQRLLAEGFKIVTEEELRERFAIDKMIRAERDSMMTTSFHWEFEYDIQYDRLDTYINDKIPERCLKSIEHVKNLGVKNNQLFVAYPVRNKVKRKDPVILAKLSQTSWIEVDMWE